MRTLQVTLGIAHALEGCHLVIHIAAEPYAFHGPAVGGIAHDASHRFNPDKFVVLHTDTVTGLKQVGAKGGGFDFFVECLIAVFRVDTLIEGIEIQIDTAGIEAQDLIQFR